MRPCKLRKYLETAHKDKKDKPLDYFKKLGDNFQTRTTVKRMLSERATTVDKDFLTSYEISNSIAKAGKPHNIGECIGVCVISTAVNQSGHEITQVIPFSNLSVLKRIDEMADDLEKQLVPQIQVRKFALQIDESCLQENEALLMTHVRFLDDNQFREEMLFA
ncbi:zinc finger BED domain-containing protein 5-like [Tachypleus tridentatus]|uniref:zinc finger BED domain-containing protein 5-like n=1 Tax=Tachypleus tridentatus TaxID=6853 RepID=UPI003FCF1383